MLLFLTQGEKVEFTCAGCKAFYASKVEQFHTLPLVLVLHLKRFGGPGGLEKLETLLFPSELRLSTLCGDIVPAHRPCLTNQAPNIQVSIPQTLASQVSSPPGEAKDSALCSSGQYISDILNASGNWFCCNDSQVSMSNEAECLPALLYVQGRRAGGPSTQALTGPPAPTGSALGPASTPQAQPSLNRGSTRPRLNTPSPASTRAAPGPASAPSAQPQQG
ncbi:uncharacterized protein LOC129842481 [Salvelinus fontinalis]|uniref:uncharacterized protein LOC129842481 n=1 Tax=Salvelinus fontinalis TaxID=8038 RepID=UPI002485AAA3|nr:uncharacterized protein LOC129842481 [Salvelinus fontinalis]